MANSIVDDMLALFTPEEQAAARAKLQANPELVARAQDQARIYSIYENPFADDAPAPVVTPTPHVPSVPGAPATPVVAAPAIPVATPTPTPTPTGNAGHDAVAEASRLEAIVDRRVAAEVAKIRTSIEKDYVSVSKLPEYRSEIMGGAIRTADEWMDIKMEHQREFGERLDTASVNKFINDNGGGARFRTVTDAYNAMVNEKRIEARVAKGVEEGVKQKTSAMTVPAVTSSTATPALALIDKARKAGAGVDGVSAVHAAAQRLRQVRQAREGAGAE